MSDPATDKMQEILGNPDTLALIARLVSGLGKSGGQSEPAHEVPESDAPTAAFHPPESLPSVSEASLPILSAPAFKDASSDRRIALLNALRPYINDSKKERVDGLVRAIRVAGVLNQYKGTLL